MPHTVHDKHDGPCICASHLWCIAACYATPLHCTPFIAVPCSSVQPVSVEPETQPLETKHALAAGATKGEGACTVSGAPAITASEAVVAAAEGASGGLQAGGWGGGVSSPVYGI